MINEIEYSKQHGVALVLSLLLLFVMITLGVAGFSNTHLQERSASNARLQAEAFKAASAGSADAVNWFEDNRDRSDINISDTACGTLGHEGWYDADGNPVPTDWVNAGTIGQASLDQRMYCLADVYPCNEDVEVDCSVVTRPPRSQLFVQSRGQVMVGDKVVARRDVEVRLAKGQEGAPGDGCGAICFPGCDIDPNGTVFPNSNSFQIDGNGGPAITVGCDAGRDMVLGEIRDNRIGNYIGGVVASSAGLPWDTPENVENFRAGVEQAAQNAVSGGCANCFYASGLSVNGNVSFGNADSPQITYVNGNASIGGNVSGAGIFFVNGNLSMNGTPAFQGLIVVLGGEWSIDGGGRGGNPGQQSESGGSVVVLNAPGVVNGSVQDFGEVSFDNNGGGNALYRSDCGMLNQARDLLPAAMQAMWNPECNDVEDIFALGAEEIIIASWRENIGWREDHFSD